MIPAIYTQQAQKRRCEKTQSSFFTSPVDLRFVEQLIDGEQTNALAQMLRYCLEKQLLWKLSVPETVAFLEKEIQKGGLCAISDSSYAAMGLCLPRTQEIFACLNRYRG